MSRRFILLPQLEGDQARAADPKAHAALSASAGTGKTQVLTARVLRLLLQGARPESILCLTFTKAAAAEMANRIGARLAAWVRLPDKLLRKDLFALNERDDPRTMERARQLFARVLDCPGGLKIQTIHAFAQSLLAAFPAEAGITPGFQPIEGRAEQELVRRTLADLMVDAEARGDEQLMGDVQSLSRRLGETGAVEYLQACARKAEAMRRMGPPGSIEAMIRALLRLPNGSIDDYLAAQCADDGFDCDLLRAIAGANRSWGTSTGAKIVTDIETWLEMAPSARAGALPDLSSVVFTGKGELRKTQAGQLKADPAYDGHVQRLAERMAELLQVQRASRLAADMAAGLRAGQAFAEAYTRAKRAAGVADFNDLIDWTRHLLAQPGIGDWVRYKLDREVDHVLVDEAQDTNAAQWEIIEAIVEEYFSGSSEAEQRRRTLFMVGDFKQAIFGFQGTDPQRFREAREHFRRKADELAEAEAATEFRDLSIAASFRSSQPVLDIVDAVIDTLGAEALGLARRPPPHRAFHRDRPGQVELWQPFAPEFDENGDEGEETWVSLRARQYADALAERIRELVEEAPHLPSTQQTLTPGDILVLVRSRGELASLIVARLFSAGVPVAGVDRLHLHEPLAVQDLLAAVKFAVQPDDDLSLACLLVSPLIGWDQEQLRVVAFGRKSSLWRELRQRRGEFPEVFEVLSELLRIADFTTPSVFLETILSGPMQGRRKLYARLGMAARDPIDELLDSALEFERNETASLDRFLAWFSRGTVDVQRDPGRPGNEVRVMTVHGAKGLEAPVVILADATADPARLGRTPLTLDFEVVEGGGAAPLLRPKREEHTPPFEQQIVAEEKRDLEEHWRLLYVALTRAADRLIVAGVAPKPKKDGSEARPLNCWHFAVERAMESLGAEGSAHGKWGAGLFYGSPAPAGKRRPEKAAPSETAIPGWALTPAPPEARPPRPLAPSAIATDDESAPPPSEATRAAALRGTWIHQLLERLPAVPPAYRAAAADRWLERSAGQTDAAARAEIVDQVCGIISDRRFSALFGEGSLGEAPLAATLPDGRVIAGTVDRLLVEEARICVIDFKTGRVPASDADIPNAHRAQMEAYVDALRVIFPERRISASLLYTAGPKLIELLP